MRKNLAINGGFLDEVHFLLHAKRDEDVPWLDDLLRESPELVNQYKLYDYSDTEYRHLWQHCDEPDTMYIKIDDDVVSLESLVCIVCSLLTQ